MPSPLHVFRVFVSSSRPNLPVRRSSGSRALWFETLERRCLLAATDLAAIEGTVFEDADGDNSPDPGEVLAGVTVELYRDDGDGIFEPGADGPREATDVTDGNGQYRFEDLTEGTYFVRQPPLGGLDEEVGLPITIDSTDVEGVLGTQFDEFTTPQSVTAPQPAGTTAQSSESAPEAIGGERDLFVEITEGPVLFDEVNLTVASGLLSINPTVNAKGVYTVTWDGADGDAANTDFTGLDHVDLTDGGASNHVTMIAGVDQPNGQATIRIYTDANNWSEATVTLVDTGGAPTGEYFISYEDDFADAGVDGGADFSDVGAVQLEVEGIEAAMDGQITLLGAIGPTVFTQDIDNAKRADLSLTKDVDDPTPNVGQQVNFTITLTNDGPDDATNVEVSDLLPGDLTYVSDTPEQGDYDQVIGVWTVGDLALGESVQLVIVATVTTPDEETNTAEVSASDQLDDDSTPDNGDPLEDDQDSATITPQQADLSLTKSVDDDAPNVGDDVTFTITLTNDGPDTASNVEVGDLLPAGLDFVDATPQQGAYNDGSGVWTVGTLASGASTQLEIVATVTNTGTKINTGEVTAADQYDPDSTPDNQEVGEDDLGAAEVTPQIADLSLIKTVDDSAPNVGQSVTFTVTVLNSGPDDATNVTVTDVLPAGLSFVGANPDQGSYDQPSGVWSVGTVSASAMLQIVATVTTTGTKTNTAEVSAADQFDPDSTPDNDQQDEDDQDDAEVTPQVADLSLVKSVDDSTPNVGDDVTFTLTLTNSGPDSATAVQVADTLPAGLTYVSDSADQGIYNDGTGVWTVGTVNSGASVDLDIIATVTTVGIKTNTAQVSAADQFDPDSTPGNSAAGEDDQDDASVTPQVIDLSLEKSVDDNTPDLGDNVTFAITLTNSGPDTATGVAVTDVLPAGMTFVSSDPEQGSYNSGTGVWIVGTVDADQSIGLEIVATVTTIGSKTNTAEVSAADQFDTDSTPDNGLRDEDDQDSASLIPRAADLAIVKTDSTDPAFAGDELTYTLIVTNNGPSDATGVTVEDTLPGGVTYVSATPSQGTASHSGGVVTVDLGNLANGDAATIQIVVDIDSDTNGTITNVAEVMANEPDTDPDNDRDLEPTTVQFRLSSIGGFVYLDRDDDGQLDAADIPLEGVQIVLTGTDILGAPVSDTTTTASDGSWRFIDLVPGTYTVTETQPSPFRDGTDTLGTPSLGTAGADAFVDLVLEDGVDAEDYNFGELLPIISKRHFLASS